MNSPKHKFFFFLAVKGFMYLSLTSESQTEHKNGFLKNNAKSCVEISSNIISFHPLLLAISCDPFPITTYALENHVAEKS